MHLETIGSLLGMLAITILILVLAWWVTRCVGRHWGGSGRSTGGSFAVIRQLNVGRNERLALVRIGDCCLLVGITSGGISLLKELTPEESAVWLQNPVPDIGPASGFLEILQKTGGFPWKRDSGGSCPDASVPSEDPDVSDDSRKPGGP